MTESEVIELLGDMDEPDDNTGMAIIPVDFKTAAAGETISLGEYNLSDGDEISYNISAKTGNRMKIFFAKDNQEDVAYWSVNSLRQPDGALGNVKGSVSIASTKAS